MRKIYSTLTAGTALAIALVLGSCNNAEEIKKQTAEQDAKIQSLVDAKFSALQTQATADCSARVDSLVNVQFKAWEEEQSAAHHGAKHKPTAKVVTPTKPAPAPTTISNRGGTNTGTNTNTTITNRAGTNAATGSKTTINSRGGAVKQ